MLGGIRIPRYLLGCVRLGVSEWNSKGRGCTHANEIGTLFEDYDMMSHASQRYGAGEASCPATNDDKADLKSCLLRGFMSTRLNTTLNTLIPEREKHTG
jgi:hypothetical protein